jgi:hypothetical protein
LRAQINATRDAAMALVLAHVELAKAEAGQIAGEVGRVAALGAVAIGVVIMAVILLVVGLCLFLGEWLLGSVGWGIVLGILFFASLAMACILLALGVSSRRIVRSLAVSVVMAVVVAILLGWSLPNQAYAEIAQRLAVAVDPGIAPLLVGIVIGALIGLLLGIFAAASMSASGGGRFAALAGLVVLGVVIGSLSAITYDRQAGIGLGITVGYISFLILMGIDVARTGIDLDALKARFYPGTTIDTSKETLEWLKQRMPPGIGS